VQEERVGVEGAEGIGFTMTEGGVPALQSAFPTSSLILDGISPHVSAELTDKELRDANFPMDGEGRVYHLGIKAGEVNNRILSVGSAQRAEKLSQFLDQDKPVFTKTSKRGFTIYSGTRKGVAVSIIATGMGIAMMDFVVRETAALCDGPMVIARYGTCGTIRPDIDVGSVAVASLGSVAIQRNPDAFVPGVSDEAAYRITNPVESDNELSLLIQRNLNAALGATTQVVTGMNATADSFYSSQGRIDPTFDDRNESLIDDLALSHPDVITLEMETFHVLDLARCSRGKLRASAATIVLAQRKSNAWLSSEDLERLERVGGEAVLDAVAQVSLE